MVIVCTGVLIQCLYVFSCFANIFLVPGRKVLFHCQHGRNRSMYIACCAILFHLISHGKLNEGIAAIEDAKAKRLFALDKYSVMSPFLSVFDLVKRVLPRVLEEPLVLVQLPSVSRCALLPFPVSIEGAKIPESVISETLQLGNVEIDCGMLLPGEQLNSQVIMGFISALHRKYAAVCAMYVVTSTFFYTDFFRSNSYMFPRNNREVVEILRRFSSIRWFVHDLPVLLSVD